MKLETIESLVRAASRIIEVAANSNSADEIENTTNEILAELEAESERDISLEIQLGVRSQLLHYLAVLFNGETGRCAWVPIGFTDSNGTYCEYVVISVAYMVRFFSLECPIKMNESETRSFFTENPVFPRCPELQYEDHIRLLLNTPFALRKVSGAKREKAEATNRGNFVITPLSNFKQLLRDVDASSPHPPTIGDFPGRRPKYGCVGNTFGYTTGEIDVIGRSLSLEEKRMTPAMERPWVVENYSTVVQRFFDMPADLVGKRHVVAGATKVDSRGVESHAHARGRVVRNRKKKKKRRVAKQAKRQAAEQEG